MAFFIVIQNILLAAIAAVGFALVFNVPKEYLKYCAFLGSLGYATRTLLLFLGVPSLIAILCASLSIGTVAILLSYKLLAHPKTISVAAIIPMFPGISVYKSTISMIELYHMGYSEERMAMLMTHFLSATFSIGALSIGLTLPGILIYRRRKSI